MVDGAEPMTRNYSGSLQYRQPDGPSGRELFSVTVHDDGSRTLRCQCWMDRVPLVRDVVYTVNERFEAVDCFVRVFSAGSFVGSGLFLFGEDYVEAEARTRADGRVHQRFDTPGRVKLFGSHPISVDIWKCTHTPPERQGTIQPLTNCFSSSLAPNGASGPLLNPKSYDVEFDGRERRDTVAGALECLRYKWHTHTGRTLVMCTTGADWLPIIVQVPETGRSYELTSLEGDWR
jgi:hypothetical protein